MVQRRELLFGFPLILRATVKLDEAFDTAKLSSKHGGLVVVRRGGTVFEKYFGRGHRGAAPNLASIAKSVTSIAAGILVKEKPYLFPAGLDQKIFTVRLLPRTAFPLNDPRKSRINLGQLLTMTSGIRGNSPGFILGKPTQVEAVGLDGWPACVDEAAAGASLWCSPGSGYSYATAGVHIVSMMIRRVTGMELQSFVEERIARHLHWEHWGWGYRRPEVKHTPGGGGIALRSPDVVRLGEMLLGEGRWGGTQVAPTDYVKACGRISVYNPHSPYSLQFDVNGDGHVPGIPRDAFWKTGSGGHCLYVVPSQELVIWKLGGRDGQYSATDTGVADDKPYDGSREGWKSTMTEGAAALKVLEAVSAAFV